MFLKMWKMIWNGTQDGTWCIALTCVDFILDTLMLCHGENHLNPTDKICLTGPERRTDTSVSSNGLSQENSTRNLTPRLVSSVFSIEIPAFRLTCTASRNNCKRGTLRSAYEFLQLYRKGGETTNCWKNFVLTSRSASQTKLFQTYPNIKETRWMYP